MEKKDVVALFIKLEELKKYVNILNVGFSKEEQKTVLSVGKHFGPINIYLEDVDKILKDIHVETQTCINSILQNYSVF